MARRGEGEGREGGRCSGGTEGGEEKEGLGSFDWFAFFREYLKRYGRVSDHSRQRPLKIKKLFENFLFVFFSGKS